MLLRHGFVWMILPLVGAGIAFGDDAGARANLIGTWRQASAAGPGAETWSLEDKGDEIRITHTAEGQKPTEFACNTMGRECEIKESGRHMKVSMWYNGASLVELETRGSEVIKRRLKAAGTSDLIEIEVTPIQPAGKTEVIQLQRVQMTATHK